MAGKRPSGKDRDRQFYMSYPIIPFGPLCLHICVPRTLLCAVPSETQTTVYAENTVRQNTKQILCFYSACDHLKGIFQRPGLILAPAKWSFHSALVIFSLSSRSRPGREKNLSSMREDCQKKEQFTCTWMCNRRWMPVYVELQ